MNKKPYIFLISIMCIIFVLILIFSIIKNVNTKYIIFSDGNHLKNDGKWSIISNDDVPEKEYKVVIKGNVINSKLKVFDEEIYAGNTKIISDTIAYRGKNINNKYYKELELDLNDYQYLNQVLNQKNINIDISQLSFLYKYQIDLNNDGNNEILYAVANHYDTEIGKLFSLVTIKNGQILDFNTFDDEFESYVPYLYFIEINKKTNIIFKNTYASLIGQDVKIMSFDNNLNYKIVYEEEER